MDIFVRGVPVQTTESALRDFFKPVLERFSIFRFHCNKFRNKPFALLTVTDVEKARLFLKKFGQTTRSVGSEPLLFFNTLLLVSESRNKPSEVALKALRYEEENLQRKASRNPKSAPENETATHKPSRREVQRKYDFSLFRCGIWDCDGPNIVLASQFQDRREGNLVFGKKALAMILRKDNHVAFTSRLDIPYWSIDSISTCPQMNTVTFTLTFAPRIYRMEDNTMEKLMSDLGLGSLSDRRKNNRARVSAIDESHKSVVGSCFVYQIRLASPGHISGVNHLVRTHRGMPPALSISTPQASISHTFQRDSQRLTDCLRPGSKYGDLSFSAKFQVERLLRNAYLPPYKIIALLPIIRRLSRQEGHIPATMAIQMLARQIPLPGPHLGSESLEDEFLAKTLTQYAQGFKLEGSIYDSNSWNNNQHALIHRVIITPAGTYLEGPEPEVGNRVLRRYRDHGDNFLRVEFTDEDGDYVQFEPRTNLSEIYSNRFQGVLNGTIDIGGRSFEFLGFSHSSLRQKTCWFMSPIVQDTGMVTAQDVVKDLGDFSKIRCPAKCAARIGQAFSETTATVTISREMLQATHDVVRNGRTFSDGVGTISSALLHRVWKHYGQAGGRKPTCLQIRFAGAKGMLSLDDRLQGERLILRPSMVKFEGSKTWDIEVCGANFKPLPMYLNRQLVKILEDLGVPAQNFLALEEQMVEQIRRITESPINAAIFLESARGGTRMPFLFRILDELGLSFGGDSFLSHVVEISVLSQLREVKYRSRIFVEKGVTLYGIMDETGFLEEGEIYCTFERPGEKGKLKHTVLAGKGVVVTRSPAMHPGDVQKARAVSLLPAGSPLRALSNVVVFSQKGQRDLPSQLSGGDLDGDLYNVIWDECLIPPVTHAAAEYKAVPPMDIGRPVCQKDITEFFVKFMETDQLGRICTVHMQLADRFPRGTLDPDCTKLAEMASTAVDFSKTGIPVDMKQLPRYDMTRPDFMAASPHVTVQKNGFHAAEAEDDDEDDAFEALDPDFRSFKYYESDRVLGRLYRAIDERVFFQDMHQQLQNDRRAVDDMSLMNQVWRYVLRETALIQWEGYKPLARGIREIFESNLLDAMSDFSMHPRYPLSEIEIFGGNIIGKNGGSTNRRIRERTIEMNKRFERDTAFVVQRITQGDDGDHDEALARSVACMAVGMVEQSTVSNTFGELKSWKYIAAAICLQQIEMFKNRYDPFW